MTSVWSQGSAFESSPFRGGGVAGTTSRPGLTPPSIDSGVPVVDVATYVLQPGDRLLGIVNTDSGERIAVATADHRALLVPRAGLTDGTPVVSTALVPVTQGPAAQSGAGPAQAAPVDPMKRKRKIAMVAGVTLGVLSLAASITAGVIASKQQESESAPVLDGWSDDPVPSKRRSRKKSSANVE